MKNSIIFISTVFVFLFMSSCDSSLSDIDENLQTKTTNLTIAERKINVNVVVNDVYNGSVFYRVELYDKMPSLSDAKLISVGVARADMVFSVDVMVSGATKKLYVKQIDPSQNTILIPIAIDSTTKFVRYDFRDNSLVIN